MSSLPPELDSAMSAMRGLFKPTPLHRNDYLSHLHDADIWLKREDFTPVRSYKIRGAMNFFRAYLARGGVGDRFVCASAGNHAQGFAYVCRKLHKHGTVFMPVTTPQQKIDKTAAFGGRYVTILLKGDIFDECQAAALEYAAREGAVMVPPFNHADIVSGQATVGLEMLKQLGRVPDMIVMPVGGGGLSAGVVTALRAAGVAPPIHLVEPAGAPSFHAAIQQGAPVALKKIDNFVDGASVAQMGEVPFAVLKDYAPMTSALIPENRLCSTMLKFLNIEGIVLEPAGALAIDALKDLERDGVRGKTIVCIVTGGNFDFERLPDVKERAMRFDGLKKYFIIRFPQRPGALRDFLEMLGPDDDIARFEYLKKSARNFGSVLIGLETKKAESFADLLARFDAAGVQYEDITENEILANLII
ncbi:MAG: threonine ammonia-lyase IlvA [Rhizobiaceae bacterium]|nr:threonine ammonia-lyase IlvA [Rhizobiaceae bacterium]